MAQFIPTDVLVEILQRLRPSSRRRSRLVCRLWRDIVDTRTTEMQSRPRTLVATAESLYLIEDDLPSPLDGSPAPSSSIKDLFPGGTYRGMSLVDTCNGLLCMCDNRKPGGPITLANPVTREALAIPPLPLKYAEGTWYLYLTYGFAYHPTTGRYKVVHVPYHFDRVWVYTLGEASWRGIATHIPKVTYDLYKGIVSINGTMFWVVNGTGAKIMSFDLENEQITSIRTLPNVLSRPGTWHLTEVRGRLGIAVSHESPASDRTEVWVMEHDLAGQHTWNRWYSVQMQKPARYLRQHQLTEPYFIHDGEHVLTMRWQSERGCVLYKHKPNNGSKKTRRAVVEIDKRNEGTVVADFKTSSTTFRIVSYVETREPLCVYKC